MTRRARKNVDGPTLDDFYRTGQQDCANVIDKDDFDLGAGTPQQVVAAAFARFEQDDELKETWIEQQGNDFGSLSPDEAYVSWRAGWKASAVRYVAEWQRERRADSELEDNPSRVETAKRLVVTRVPSSTKVPAKAIFDAEAAAKLAVTLLGDRAYESFLVMYLDVRNKLIGYEEMTEASPTGVSVHVPSIVRNALLAGAIGALSVHNHPSGALTPSADDTRLWAEMDLALKSQQITLVDNLIIAGDLYYSERDGGPRRIP